jgi:hypothetical protein
MNERVYPLVNDRVLREELDKLERQGLENPPSGEPTINLPPSSARRAPEIQPLAAQEIERLRKIVRANGIELVNDGASYRAKRGRDWMIWTLETSPLIAETRGGGEGQALMEIVRRFCEMES